MDIRKKIRDMRKKAGLTQAKLAEMCDVSSTHMSNIEAGRENPSFELLQKIAIAFNCELYIDFVPAGTQELLFNETGIQQLETQPAKPSTWLTFENAPARTLLAIAEAKLELEKTGMDSTAKDKINEILRGCLAIIGE